MEHNCRLTTQDLHQSTAIVSGREIRRRKICHYVGPAYTLKAQFKSLCTVRASPPDWDCYRIAFALSPQTGDVGGVLCEICEKLTGIYEHGGPRLMAELITLFQEMWRQGQVPQDLKGTTIVYGYKRKGNRQLWDNHRGISLLNIAEKIFARILLNRLNGHLEQGLRPEGQCGFRLQ
ncbi:unnamed protein product [Schistocephalus solidus]|uniref:Reverse transcriptase domain-containing protein n=1 Tax=Schistocephalus solidus TaxID=70667 RepID=A0A183SYI9_SCHSO|nr:unnamed protein product [Schistocephalus solidus]